MKTKDLFGIVLGAAGRRRNKRSLISLGGTVTILTIMDYGARVTAHKI